MQLEINIKVGNKSPKEYFRILQEQIASGALTLSGIHHEESLRENLKANCIPVEIIEMDLENY